MEALLSESVQPEGQANAEHGPDDPCGAYVPAGHAVHEVVELKSSSLVPAVHCKLAQDTFEPDGAYAPTALQGTHDVEALLS